MALLGFGDMNDQTLHSLWDLAEMKRLELRDGATFDQMLQEAQDVANAVSGEFLRLPHYSSLFAIQDTPELEYGTYTGGGIQEMTEYSVPDPYRGKTTGHMLPIKMYARTLGWTMLSLENRRRNQLEADLQVVIDDIRNQYQQLALTRFFKMEAEAVNETSGASVPFADGGTADSNWIPRPSPDGETFASTHDHYLRTATLNIGAINTAVDHLYEHGHRPPFVLVGADADSATYTALTEWLPPTWPGIVYQDAAAGTDRSTLPNIDEYRGAITTDKGLVYVWLTPRVPTGYFAVYKPYGVGAGLNPLRMRIDPQYGYGWGIVPGQYVNAPLSLAVLRGSHAFGIGEDRTNGVFTYIFASGDYVTPTIS
jgi:hypothetical protein